jgi:chaperonin GroEL (HSP60 family)
LTPPLLSLDRTNTFYGAVPAHFDLSLEVGEGRISLAEGVITVEEAKSLETELDVVEGLKFDRGYLFRKDSSSSRRSVHPHS